VKSLRKLNLIELNLDMSYKSIMKSNGKMKSIKQHFLLASSKFVLLKQKLKNLLTIHNLVKGNLSKWVEVFQGMKKYKSSNQLTILYKNLNSVRDEILHKGKTLPSSRKNLIIYEILFNKSKNKLIKLQKYFEREMSTLFVDKKENFLELFSYFTLANPSNNPNNTSDAEFFKILFDSYNKSLFNIIKSTLTSFTEESRSYFAQDVKKLRELGKLKYEENRLIQGFNQLFKNLAKVGECYNYYLNLKNALSDLIKNPSPSQSFSEK
jgi:hypothetical protein